MATTGTSGDAATGAGGHAASWWPLCVTGLIMAGALAALTATLVAGERQRAEVASTRYAETLSAIRSAERTSEAVLERIDAEAAEAESNLSFDASLDPMAGPGVRVTIDDSHAEQGTNLHDQDVLLIVNELCASDAEAVAVNGIRRHAMSSIRCTGPTIRVDGTALGPPYIIEAIGAPSALHAALLLPNGIVSELTGVSIAVVIEEIDNLELPAAPFVPLRTGQVAFAPNTD